MFIPIRIKLHLSLVFEKGNSSPIGQLRSLPPVAKSDWDACIPDGKFYIPIGITQQKTAQEEAAADAKYNDPPIASGRVQCRRLIRAAFP